MRIAINEIKIKPGRREAEPGDVRELADSIAEVGLLCPITVGWSTSCWAGISPRVWRSCCKAGRPGTAR